MTDTVAFVVTTSMTPPEGDVLRLSLASNIALQPGHVAHGYRLSRYVFDGEEVDRDEVQYIGVGTVQTRGGLIRFDVFENTEAFVLCYNNGIVYLNRDELVQLSLVEVEYDPEQLVAQMNRELQFDAQVQDASFAVLMVKVKYYLTMKRLSEIEKQRFYVYFGATMEDVFE